MPRRNVTAAAEPLRSRSGLRNKRRSGRSVYSVRGKGRSCDRYGQVRDGKCTDTIAGRQATWKPTSGPSQSV